jgi:hypothetical protein
MRVTALFHWRVRSAALIAAAEWSEPLAAAVVPDTNPCMRGSLGYAGRPGGVAARVGIAAVELVAGEEE